MIDREGYMSEEQAERSLWSYYWQLDHSRDRRVAPLVTEPPEHMSKEELAEIRDRQTPLWRKAQLKAVGIIERKNARAGGYARKFAGLFTTKAEREYVLQSVLEDEYEKYAGADLTGKVDPRTGLPWTTNDIQSGRGVVSGQELCLEAIVSPHDLAEAFTTWLPPCPGDHDLDSWGTKLEHFQSLAYKPKDKGCDPCNGTGKVERVVTATVTEGIIFRKDRSEHRKFLQTCEACGGEGCIQNWDQDEVEAVRHNAMAITRVVHGMQSTGYFDLRPVDERDVEMGDLVWERKDGTTIGFRLNWEGYKFMQEWTAKDPEIQQAMHILTLAGHEVRQSAPEWAKDEYNKSHNPITVDSAGGFKTPPVAGGFSVQPAGGKLKL